MSCTNSREDTYLTLSREVRVVEVAVAGGSFVDWF
jgi:hypothetical protein